MSDPFNGKQLCSPTCYAVRADLGLESCDFGFVKRPSVLIALGSAILFGVSIITLESLNSQQNGFQGLLEQVTEIVDPPEKSP